MAEGSYIHLPENARADLRAKLADIERREKECAAEAKPLRDAFDFALKPFVERESALSEERDDLLAQHGTFIVGHCEGCSALILDGDRVVVYDDGPFVCAECAPTWEEALENLKGDPERYADEIANAEAMIAAGRGKEKVI